MLAELKTACFDEYGMQALIIMSPVPRAGTPDDTSSLSLSSPHFEERMTFLEIAPKNTFTMYN